MSSLPLGAAVDKKEGNPRVLTDHYRPLPAIIVLTGKNVDVVAQAEIVYRARVKAETAEDELHHGAQTEGAYDRADAELPAEKNACGQDDRQDGGVDLADGDAAEMLADTDDERVARTAAKSSRHVDVAAEALHHDAQEHYRQSA